MKKIVFIVASLAVVLACFSVAVIEYNNHKVTEAAAVNSKVKQANDTLKLHDAVNAQAIKDAGNQINALMAQKVTLCAQIKTAPKLVQPLCQ